MSVLQAEVYEAFRMLDVPDDKALKAAVALSAALTKVEDETAKNFSKRDADVEAIRRDIASINKDVAGINTRLAVMQGDMRSDMVALESGLTDRLRTQDFDLSGRMASMQSDLNGRMASMQSDLNGRMASMPGEINLLKWMMGTVIALLVTVMFRVFTH